MSKFQIKDSRHPHMQKSKTTRRMHESTTSIACSSRWWERASTLYASFQLWMYANGPYPADRLPVSLPLARVLMVQYKYVVRWLAEPRSHFKHSLLHYPCTFDAFDSDCLLWCCSRLFLASKAIALHWVVDGGTRGRGYYGTVGWVDMVRSTR